MCLTFDVSDGPPDQDDFLLGVILGASGRSEQPCPHIYNKTRIKGRGQPRLFVCLCFAGQEQQGINQPQSMKLTGDNHGGGGMVFDIGDLFCVFVDGEPVTGDQTHTGGTVSCVC